jgi:hypothetical protein
LLLYLDEAGTTNYAFLASWLAIGWAGDKLYVQKGSIENNLTISSRLAGWRKAERRCCSTLRVETGSC